MSSHHIGFVLFAVAALACDPSGLKGDSLVVPNALANTEGDSNNGIPFNISGGRYQQVYAASQFPSSPIRITGMSFRPDGEYAVPFNTTLPDVQINLSTSTHLVDGLSTTFALNVGADDTVVRSGGLPLSSAATGPFLGPKQFDISITFFTSFVYNPAAGNLLLDVRNFGGGTTPPFDAAYIENDPLSRTFTLSGSVNSTDAEDADTLGLVTQFTFTIVPEPSTLALAAFGFAGLAAWGWWRRRRALG
jgi:PEP-CTERM motif